MTTALLNRRNRTGTWRHSDPAPAQDGAWQRTYRGISGKGRQDFFTEQLQAPLFIKNGEKIKVDTRTGKYMERA